MTKSELEFIYEVLGEDYETLAFPRSTSYLQYWLIEGEHLAKIADALGIIKMELDFIKGVK